MVRIIDQVRIFISLLTIDFYFLLSFCIINVIFVALFSRTSIRSDHVLSLIEFILV